MQFMYICTHPAEKCLVDEPDVTRQMIEQTRVEAEKVRVKVMGPFIASQEHTIYAVFEGNDFDSVQKAMAPLLPWGSARLIPVSSTG